MTLSLEYFVRHEGGKLLRDRFPGPVLLRLLPCGVSTGCFGHHLDETQIERA
jgi:hypothetical protein